MANERDLDRLLREKLSQVQRLAERKLISGYRDNNGDIVLRDVASPQGTFYARTVQDSRDKLVIYGSCSVVNVPFVAEYDGNGNLVYKYQDTEIADLQTQGTAQVIFAPPAIPNLSQINVGDYQFAPLRVNFDTSGGLSVAVGAGWHVGDLFEGGTIDLTSNVPATPGEVRWVVVGIDTTTNALTAINGTPITGTQQDLVIADIADIAIPTGVMPLGAVALENGQTAITQGTSWIVDIRRHHDLGGGGYYETIEDNGTPETQRGILNFADNATGAIDFTATDDGANDRTTITAELDIEGLAEDNAPPSTAFVVISDSGVLAKTSLADLPAGSLSVQVTDNTTTVTADTILFNPANFVVTDNGGGEAEVEAVTGGATIYAGTVLWETVLSGSGTFDTNNADDEGRTGFSSTYDVIVMEFALRSTVAATIDGTRIYFNNDSTSTNYRYRLGTNANTYANADGAAYVVVNGASSPTSNFTIGQVYLPDYASSKNKNAQGYYSARYDTTSVQSQGADFSVNWENTAAITRIQIVTDNDPTDTFAAGSYLRIIGYKTRTVGNILNTSSANVSNPPTDAELDAALGTPASVGNGFAALLDDNGADTNVYFVASNGTSWFYLQMTKAV